MAGYTLYQAHQRLADTLSPQHENKVSRLTLRVNDIARFSPGSITFDAEVLSAHGIASGIPRFIRVYWSQTKQFQLYQEIQVASMPNVRPGQVWDMWLLLKRPNTLMNPGGFDNESYLFRENIRALGTVKGQPQLLQQAQHTFHTQIQAWRHDLRKAMQAYVEGKRYGAVLIALVMGDQEGISQEDWQLFNRTGMSHLVSISGSHITVLSALATVLCLWGLRRIRYRGNLLAHYCDITWIAAGVGVIVALLYCLLAGWGIPAQRTFFMLLLTYLLHGSSVRLSLPTIFLIIAIVVSIFDPWALLSAGFYLSFAAVAVLQQLSVRFRAFSTKSSLPLQGKVRLSHKGVRFLKEWLLLQGMVTVAAVPFLMYFFHQVSLISPVVNAYAIFLIGMVVTPLSLCMGGLSVLVEIFPSLVVVVQWLADIAHNVLQWVMQVSAWLSTWRWASVDTSDVPIWALGLCGIGIVLLIMPKGLPLQRYGLLFVAPAFLLVDRPLQAGEWQLYAFDIGQGGSVLVKTANHALLFDTGVRVSPTNESGSRVLLPAFRALGVKTLDTLVVSHADIDHSGGLKTVLENIPVARIYASFQVDKFLQQQSAAPHPLTILERDAQQIGIGGQQQSKISLSQASELPPLLVKWLAEGTEDVCQQGVSFVFDEVRFRFLNRHPALSAPQINSLNSLPTPQGKVLALSTPQGKVLALPTPQGKVLSLSTPQGKVLSLAGETSSFSTMYLQRPMSQSKATLPFALSSTTRLPVPLKSSNQQSCVLSIEGKYHRALLTGDITRMQEQSLVEDGELTIPYEVVQVPHHGSSSSSSLLLVQYTQPLLAIAQTGYLNRFKHPVPEIRQRWEDNGAVFLNTADTGAVHVVSQAMGIAYYRWREQHRRYWHR
ncbi:DNA internalization-related competence protein ComEC/Rec2 [Pelistega europaea]|uniref:DNA internalization-related competence protein ComEC/Rec2 n=2 Tax=Pelistega europaea TaxID=106147 RepID=A0A7Y4LB07_9BURK|nr:DNA internalization-related competence protein ComEC/Rec2 [Pelistega europaea]